MVWSTIERTESIVRDLMMCTFGNGRDLTKVSVSGVPNYNGLDLVVPLSRETSTGSL
jgi:hypothetical protein